MTVQSEPPQAKGINTNPANIQKIDPLAGIKNINPPEPNNNGSANLSYPISIPEGINKLTPKLSINYSSDAGFGNCGVGWGLSLSSITIKTKNKGVPKYDGNDILLLDERELVKINATAYRFKVEGSFSKIEKNRDGFIVYETDGTRMYYGENDNTRLSDPDNTSHIFIWKLSRIVDKFNNQIKYEYQEIFENSIRVNSLISKISYGYNDIYTVNFTWEDRPDIRISCKGGFRIIINKRLKDIIVKNNATDLKKEELDYEVNLQNKSILKRIRELVGIEINVQEFEYDNRQNNIGYNGQTGQTEWWNTNSTGQNMPIWADSTGYGDYTILLDMNGDGLPDRVSHYNYQESDSGLWVALNNGNGFDTQTEWYDSGINGGPNWPRYCNSGGDYNILLDMTGDGLPDRVSHSNYQTNDPGLWVIKNTGNGFEKDENGNYIQTEWWNTSSNNNQNRPRWNDGYGSTYTDLIDMNGDSLPDRVSYYDYAGGRGYGLWVALNNGNGFEPIIEWYKSTKTNHNYPKWLNAYGSTYADLIDMNGDALPDKITYYDYDGGRGYGWWVALNNGNDFDVYKKWRDAVVNSDPDYPQHHCSSGEYNILLDMDGDGLPDRAGHYNYNTNNPGLWITKNQTSLNLLTSITNSKTNISINLTYSQIPVPLIGQKKVLSSITTGNTDLSITTTVEYETGIVDRLEKEFRGFEKVTSMLVDTEKNVTHITETTYRINDIIGYDSFNNPIYDEYLKGQVDTVTNLFDNGISLRTLSKQKYNYQKDEILTGFSDVKFVYPKETRVWLYDDNGNYLGNNDILVGDKNAEVNYNYDPTNGIITKAVSFDYLDPHHNYDDVQSIVDYTVNLTRWLNLPYKIEQIDLRNSSRISLKTIYYDNQPEGVLTDGILSSERVWNNNGNDAITSFQFDSYGNSTNITSPNGLSISNVTNYLANNDYYIETVKTFPDGLTETIRQDIYGRIKESVDIYGDITKIFMDNYGRIIKVVEPQDTEASPTKEIAYDTNSGYFRAIAKYKDESIDNYLTVQFYKDGLGREVQTKNEGYINGNRVWIVSGKSIYDSMGRTISTGSVSTTDFTNTGYIDVGLISPITNYHYDEFGRLNQTDSPTGFIIYNSFEIFIDTDNTPLHPYNRILGGAVVSDSVGHVKKTYKDLSKQEVKNQTLKEDSTYATTEMAYDLHGYAKVIESDNSTIGEKQVDSLGRMKYIKRPDAGKIEYQYNNLGLVNKVLDYGKNEADWREVNYNYDSINRITDIDYTGTDNDIRYIYYGIDASIPKYCRSAIKEINKGQAANPYYKVEYLYDQFWVKESKTIDNVLYDTTYEYDMQGRIKNLTYPDGEIVRYYYDEGGFLSRIQGNQIYIDEIRYNEFGQRAYLKYGNGSDMAYTYDPNSRLLDIFTTKDILGNEILRYDYNFNPFGNITSIIDSPNGTANATQNYQYDLLNRLVHADGNYKNGIDTYNQNYQYDDDNRIIQKNYGNGMIYDFHYISNTHAVSYIDVTNGNSGITKINFNYDDYGNMIQKEMIAGTVPIETDAYTYDASNKLINIDNGITELNFKYDNKGQRIKKVFEDEVGVIKETIYVNGFYLVSDGRTDKHISDGKNIVATKLNNDQNDIYYYHSNHIGSTAAMTKADGQKFQKFHYFPYGEMWQKEESVADENLNILYAGAYFDQESGLYYMNARYYDPEIGMFMNPDPGMDGLNHYAYANCNPIMFFDPTGLDCGISLLIAAICIVIAAIIGVVCAYVANNCGGKQGSAASVTGSGSVGIGSGSSSSGGSSSDGGVSSGGSGSGSGSGGRNNNDNNPSDNVVVNNSDYSSGNGENKYIFSYNVFKSVFGQEESENVSLNVNEEAILEVLYDSHTSPVAATSYPTYYSTPNVNLDITKVAFFDQRDLFPSIKIGDLNIACAGTGVINGMSIMYTMLTGKTLTSSLAKKMANATIESGGMSVENGLDSDKFLNTAWKVLQDNGWPFTDKRLNGTWVSGSGQFYIMKGDRYEKFWRDGHWELIISPSKSVDSWGGKVRDIIVSWDKLFQFGFIGSKK